jgi:hypothetical protein
VDNQDTKDIRESGNILNVQIHLVKQCRHASHPWKVEATQIKKRQVFDLPPIKVSNRTQVEIKHCPHCEAETYLFSTGVAQPRSMGRDQSIAVYLNQCQMLPWNG